MSPWNRRMLHDLTDAERDAKRLQAEEVARRDRIARSIHDEEVQVFRERTLSPWVRNAEERALPGKVLR